MSSKIIPLGNVHLIAPFFFFYKGFFSFLIMYPVIISIIDPKDIKMGKLPGKPFIQTDYSNSARVSELITSVTSIIYPS